VQPWSKLEEKVLPIGFSVRRRERRGGAGVLRTHNPKNHNLCRDYGSLANLDKDDLLRRGRCMRTHRHQYRKGLFIFVLFILFKYGLTKAVMNMEVTAPVDHILKLKGVFLLLKKNYSFEGRRRCNKRRNSCETYCSVS